MYTLPKGTCKLFFEVVSKLKKIMSFISFTVDGLVYRCNEQGFPITLTRKTARKTPFKEADVERAFLQRMKAENIDLTETETYKWFRSKLGKPVWSNTSSLGRLLSSLMHIEFPREAYRRANTTIYWFHCHWSDITLFLRIHKVTGLHSTKGTITFDAPLQLPKIIWVIH